MHYKFGVAPYLYITGYNFFQCELIKLISEDRAEDVDLSSVLTSVIKVINLDMDLALSAYTREYWRDAIKGTEPGTDTNRVMV